MRILVGVLAASTLIAMTAGAHSFSFKVPRPRVQEVETLLPPDVLGKGAGQAGRAVDRSADPQQPTPTEDRESGRLAVLSKFVAQFTSECVRAKSAQRVVHFLQKNAFDPDSVEEMADLLDRRKEGRPYYYLQYLSRKMQVGDSEELIYAHTGVAKDKDGKIWISCGFRTTKEVASVRDIEIMYRSYSIRPFSWSKGDGVKRKTFDKAKHQNRLVDFEIHDHDDGDIVAYFDVEIP